MAIHNKSKDNIMLNGKEGETYLSVEIILRSETMMPTSTSIFNIVMEVLSREIKKEKEINGT